MRNTIKTWNFFFFYYITSICNSDSDSRSILFQLILSWLCYFNKYIRKCICKSLCVKKERLLLRKEWNKSVRNELHVPSLNVYLSSCMYLWLELCHVSHLVLCQNTKIAKDSCSLRAKWHLQLSRKSGEKVLQNCFQRSGLWTGQATVQSSKTHWKSFIC